MLKIYAAPLTALEASAAIEMNCGPLRKAAWRSAVDPHLVLGEFLGEWKEMDGEGNHRKTKGVR
jgi:hypothetical protein